MPTYTIMTKSVSTKPQLQQQAGPWHCWSWTTAAYEREEDRSQYRCLAREPTHIATTSTMY